MKFGLIDVGWLVEVRTRTEPWHDLILRPPDRADLPYILAICYGLRRVDLVGWTMGSEGKRPEFWKQPNNRPPAYFVPQKHLQPMHALLLGGP